MTIKQILSIALWLALWGPIVFFSGLLAHNAILYFTQGSEYGILPEKVVARQDLLWNICFYAHLPTGIFCLLSPIFLFTRRFFKKGLVLHQRIGQWYVWLTIFLVCPTGMYLALYAKGGIMSQLGFLLHGILLGWFTYQGYLAIQKGDKKTHFVYMTRSYAIATAVLSFRIFHLLFFILKVPYQDNYALSQWLGLSTNALLAELILFFYLSKQSLPLKQISL